MIAVITQRDLGLAYKALLKFVGSKFPILAFMDVEWHSQTSVQRNLDNAIAGDGIGIGVEADDFESCHCYRLVSG